MLKIPLVLIMVSILTSCTDVALNVINFQKEVFPIAEWQIVGPINSDSIISGINLMAHDQESYFSKNVWKWGRCKAFEHSPYYAQDIDLYRYSNKTGLIEFPEEYRKAVNVVAYAKSVVSSSTERDLILLLGCDDGLAVTVNGKLVYKNTDKRSFGAYTNAVKVHLSKGDNEINLKCFYDQRFKKGKPWRVACSLMSMEVYFKRYLKGKHDYIKSSVIPLFQPLEVKASSCIYFPLNELIIKDCKGSVVKKKTCIEKQDEPLDLEGLKEGLYSVEFFINNYKYEQKFFYGDVLSAIENKVKMIESNHLEILDVDSLSLVSVLQRRELLLNHYYPKRHLKIEVFDDYESYMHIDSFLNFPSRMIPLHESKCIRLSSKGTNGVSEIKLYDDSLKEIAWGTDQVDEYKMLIDNDKNTLWRLNKRHQKAITIKPKNDVAASYIQIIPEQNDWECALERKWVYVFSELVSLLYSDLDSISGGTHLSSIVSPVDGSLQPYVIQCPQDNSWFENRIPLVVDIPVAMSQKMPFFKSIVLANQANLEYAQFYVDKHKFIRVIPSVRSLNLQNVPICEADILATIEAVKQRYNIDNERVYLTSTCGGVSLALNLAKKYPSLFSAISLDEVSVQTSASNAIEQRELPINMLDNITHIPVQIIQGAKNSHSPISATNFLVKCLSDNGIAVDYVIHQDEIKGMKDKMRNFELAFSFLMKYARSNLDTISISTYSTCPKRSAWLEIECLIYNEIAKAQAMVDANTIEINCSNVNQISLLTEFLPCDLGMDLFVRINGESIVYHPPFNERIDLLNREEFESLRKESGREGPISDVYRDDFVLVLGTVGNVAQNKMNERITETFKQRWYEDFFVELQVVKDVDVTDKKKKESNLVLVGNQCSNKLTDEFYRLLPQKLMCSEVDVAGTKYPQEDIAFTFVYPHPLDSKRYIQVIGSNCNQALDWDFRNFSLSGFFDYEIYVRKNQDFVLAGVGDFDNNWSY